MKLIQNKISVNKRPKAFRKVKQRSPEKSREEKNREKMVARKFFVQYGDLAYDVDYDTDDGFEVLMFQLFSLTSIPPAQQKIWGGDDDHVVLDDSDLNLISDKLRLASVDGSEEPKEMVKPAVEFEKSDEELARILQAEEEALMMQHFISSGNITQVEQKIRPYVDQVLMYEEPHRQETARKTVPVDKLEEKAVVALAREGNFSPTKDELDHAFLLQMLFWFKQSFRWVNAPQCDNCNNDTINLGMGVANHLELQFGASRVEIYRCKSCSTITRFPRYNDPLKLLETRKGRCGEWANCFTLYCRAFGYDSRLILDFTDHVWTECFSPYLGRWMHFDPCEGIYDNPLLYEKGWNKKLSYVISLSKHGVCDVTKRYTRKWPEVLSRRVLTTEPTLAAILINITGERRRNLTAEMHIKLDENDKSELEELERNLYSVDDASVSLPGRQSGDKSWRLSRAEFGSDDHCSISSSSCPVRRCIDEHVTKIYNAFSPVIYQLVEQASNKSSATEILETFNTILVSLKNSSFRIRRTKLNPMSINSLFFKMIPSFGELFDALSLKTEAATGGAMDICIASDPVKTSLALPVVFHALDDLIHNVNNCETLKTSLHWPLLKLNRICSGFVLASGEELPFGIATSAFDGTRMSKWEEPNGANRVIEGSADGGSSWLILDKQTSQEFDKSYQRKTYEIRSQSFSANAFRFRFIAVRDVKSTSRFQIGSIDLYARTNTVTERK